MKTEFQVCNKSEHDVDAYLVSSAQTEFSTSEDTAELAAAVGGIAEPDPLKKVLERNKDEAPEHIKKLGKIAIRRWANTPVFKQRVNLIALHAARSS